MWKALEIIVLLLCLVGVVGIVAIIYRQVWLVEHYPEYRSDD